MYCLNSSLFNVDHERKEIFVGSYGSAFSSPETRLESFQNLLALLSQPIYADYQIKVMGDMNTYGLFADTLEGHDGIKIALLLERILPFIHNRDENNILEMLVDQQESAMAFLEPSETTFGSSEEGFKNYLIRFLGLRLDLALTNVPQSTTETKDLGPEFDHKLSILKS